MMNLQKPCELPFKEMKGKKKKAQNAEINQLHDGIKLMLKFCKLFQI